MMILQLKGRCWDLTAWLQKIFNPRKYNILAYLPTHCDDFDKWKDVLYAIDFGKIPAHVSTLRQKRQESLDPDWVKITPHVEIEKPALAGSFHIAFIIKFSDSVKWILKIPATGYKGRSTDIEARALRSEALTMQLLRRETTIPIPEVYAYSNSCDNEIKCPFILMEYVEGIPLHECWFNPNRKISQDELEQHRETALKEIASAMLQMDKFTFSQAGQPLFDEKGALTSVGPMKQYDTHAMVAKIDTENDDESAIFRETGPVSDSKSWMLNMLNQRSASEVSMPATPYKLGIQTLCRLFVDWLPNAHESGDKESFVLTHPDFNVQNILVSEEGKVLSFIDWDGVSSVPRCMGNERYPSWLTRDWDRVAYRYEVKPEADNSPSNDEGEEEDEAGLPENSPEEIKHYRAMYASIIANLKSGSNSSSSFSSTTIQDDCGNDPATELTRHSLILDNLNIALDNEMTTFYIVERIFNEMVKLQTNGQITNNRDLRLTDYSDDEDDEDENEEEGDECDEGENKEEGDEDKDENKEEGDEDKDGIVKDDNNGDEGEGKHEVLDEDLVEDGAESVSTESSDDSDFYWPKTLHYVCSSLAKGERDEKMLRGVRDGFLMLFEQTY